MLCLNFYWRPSQWGLWWFHSHTMRSLCIRLGPIGVEVNNNHVWALKEKR